MLYYKRAFTAEPVRVSSCTGKKQYKRHISFLGRARVIFFIISFYCFTSDNYYHCRRRFQRINRFTRRGNRLEYHIPTVYECNIVYYYT